MGIENGIYSRLNLVLSQFFNGKQSNLVAKTGLSKSSVSRLYSSNTEPTFTILSGILSACPDISAEWLMRGEGEMIKPEASTIQMSATDLTYYTRLLQIKQARIEELEAELARVKSIAV